MLCKPQSGNNWFRACAQGDKATVERLKVRQKGLYDTRATTANGLVFKGFVGLHYAAYFNQIDIVEAIIALEYDRLTQNSIVVYPQMSSASLSLTALEGAESKTPVAPQNKARNQVGDDLRTKRPLISRGRSPSAIARPSTFSTHSGTVSVPMYPASHMNANSPHVLQSGMQPFTLDKGSSALMIAITRGNFKLANYIITWISRKKDSERNAMIKLQNSGSMSALMLLCTMRSATAAAALQAGDLLLLKHEFVLLTKDGKSCLHCCIDSGSEAMLETICKIMCDKPLQNEDGYVLKYRLALMLLYDKSLARTAKPTKITPTPSSVNFTSTEADASLDDRTPEENIIDLEGLAMACTSPSVGSVTVDSHTIDPDIAGSKQQTLLDYTLYQTGMLSEAVRSRIYALLYYYIKRIYEWTIRDYIDVCKKYNNMTPDLQFLRHAKRWAGFETRYPEPRIPYNGSDYEKLQPQQDEKAKLLPNSQLISAGLSPSMNFALHRRCTSLTFLSNACTGSNLASSTVLPADTHINNARPPLMRYSSTNSISKSEDLQQNPSCMRPRTNSVQHLFCEDCSTKSDSMSISDDIEDLTAVSLHVSQCQDADGAAEGTEDTARALAESPRENNDSLEKAGTCVHIKLPGSVCSESSSISTSPPQTPGSIRHNAFQRIRNIQRSLQSDIEPEPEPPSGSDSFVQSCSELNNSISCNKSIIQLNGQMSSEGDSDSERASVINIGPI